MKREKPFPFEMISVVLLVIMYLSLIALAVWTSDKGLSIIDEGFYLLQAQYPHEVIASSTSYYYYSAFVFKLTGYNVVAFRLIGLSLMFTSAGLFYLGFLNMLKLTGLPFPQTRSFRINCWAFLGLGMMLYYSAFIQHRLSLSYNLLNTVALYSAIGLFFLGAGFEKDSGKRQRLSSIAFLLTGTFIGISFFSKFPTAVILLFMLPLLSIRGILNRYGHTMLLIGIGFFLWLSFHFVFFQTPAEWWGNFSRSHVFMKPYGLIFLINQYYHQTLALSKTSLRGLLLSHILLLSGFTLLFVLERTKILCGTKKTMLFLLVFVLAAIELGKKVSEPGAWGINVINLYTSWLLLLFTAAILNALYYRLNDKQLIKTWLLLLPLCLCLFCSPFAAAIGTANNININLIWHLAPWFGLMLFFLIILSGPEKGQILISTGTLIIGIFVAAHIWYGALKPAAPYQADGILKFTEPTAIGMPVAFLKLDVETSKFYKNIRHAALKNGFRQGDDLLAFFDMPGLVFAMGGKSPGCTWYFGNWYAGANDAIESVLGFVSPERLKKAFVLQSSDSQQLPDLKRFGIRFPQAYVLCGGFLFPGKNNMIYLWKPQNLNPKNDF